MQNRRRFVRHRTLKGGCLYDEKSARTECLIPDLSDGGARVEVPEGRHVPSELLLAFDDGRASRHCFVKWRRGNSLGMEFIDANRSLSWNSATPADS
jgi:hypothetical protein